MKWPTNSQSLAQYERRMFELIRYRIAAWLIVGLLGACAAKPDNFIGHQADEFYEINSFADSAVSSAIERTKDKRALFVFDIDNTLLAFPDHQFVGSDQWYQWQRDLPSGSPRKIHCVFEMQAIAYRLQRLIATEKGKSAEFVRSLQQSGKDVIAVTARGHDVRAATERELGRNGFDFSLSLPGGHIGFVESFVPPPNSVLPSPRAADYQNGVAMLAGQNKGYLLADVLSRIGLGDSYDYVVFFDDNPKNTTAVFDWFSMDRISALVFLYNGVNVDLTQYDLNVAEQETDMLLRVFGAFDRAQECGAAK